MKGQSLFTGKLFWHGLLCCGEDYSLTLSQLIYLCPHHHLFIATASSAVKYSSKSTDWLTCIVLS